MSGIASRRSAASPCSSSSETRAQLPDERDLRVECRRRGARAGERVAGERAQ
jgi:hypothetical protein